VELPGPAVRLGLLHLPPLRQSLVIGSNNASSPEGARSPAADQPGPLTSRPRNQAPVRWSCPRGWVGVPSHTSLFRVRARAREGKWSALGRWQSWAAMKGLEHGAATTTEARRSPQSGPAAGCAMRGGAAGHLLHPPC
jgi:hypothetical protein